MRAVACVVLFAAVVAMAMDAEFEAGKPTHRPIIIGADRPRWSHPLKVVIVPKGDPRARRSAAGNPFVTPAVNVHAPASTPSTPASSVPVLRASAPLSEVTVTQMINCMPGLSSSKAATALPFMNAAMKEAEINTCIRTAAFLAQLGHESGSLMYMEEIASGAAYEGRKDLGNTQPGDGKKYKGRGPIQLTGRANYAAAGKALGLDLINNPTTVATNAVGFRTSAWFWKSNGLNALADAGSFSAITKKINGGTNGAADRNMRYAKCQTALNCNGAADPFAQCKAKGGNCQTSSCSGSIVRNLCGSGAETCCMPAATTPTTPTTPAADPFPQCTAKGGKCQTTTCSGTIVHNLCGSGAPTCCVPKTLQAAVPTATAAVAGPVVGEKGADVSVLLSTKTAQCLKTGGYTWVSVRAGRSTGKPDTNAPASLKAAAAAGYAPAALSVYIFPMSNTADTTQGGKQVTAMWNSLASVKTLFNTIWLDIEAAKWSTTANNQKFFESMLAACKATGKTCGVYTSKVFWTQIMGSTYKGGASQPLWYPHYDSKTAMTDFVSFGGWTQPWAKQWKETATVCGIGADLNVKNSAFKAPLQSAAPVPAPTTTVLRAAAPAPATSASSVTAAQLVKCMPGLTTAKANTVLPFINAAQAGASINTCKRKTAWLAQLGHESMSLRYMEEIASGAAYEGRKDLGNTVKGDGKKFKGRGPIQLTGRANYAAAGKALGLNLIANPTSVATNAVGFKTSAWFWSTHGLNALADAGSFSAITKKINGGTNGAADRNSRYATCRKALGC